MLPRARGGDPSGWSETSRVDSTQLRFWQSVGGMAALYVFHAAGLTSGRLCSRGSARMRPMARASPQNGPISQSAGVSPQHPKIPPQAPGLFRNWGVPLQRTVCGSYNTHRAWIMVRGVSPGTCPLACSSQGPRCVSRTRRARQENNPLILVRRSSIRSSACPGGGPRHGMETEPCLSILAVLRKK